MGRPNSRAYYYIDYKRFLDVIKWRMMAMRRSIDTRLRRELDNKGYLCPRCRKSYSALEVSDLLDFSRNVFVCNVPGCGTELIDNEDAEDVRKSKDTLTRFNEQFGNVQLILRSVEGVALSSYVHVWSAADGRLDVRAWLAKNAAHQPWGDAANEPALPAHGAHDTAASAAAPRVRVELSDAGPEAELERQRARADEEQQQRKQNTLPAWYVSSTVSGERTGLEKADASARGGAHAFADPAAEASASDVDMDCA